ncbi:MAG: hypothetical protein M1830_000923 [Pleopsidium flavum]|nr:MAG: hypothetical protein M1830_000923 [Pleopsidium flavum]
MTPHNTPTDTVDIPENFSPDRPPILNETYTSTTSDFTSKDSREDPHFEDLVARLDELDLVDNEQQEGLSSTPSRVFHSMPYQAYSIESTPDVNLDVDAEATITQFLHDHRLNHTERRFLADRTNSSHLPPNPR